MQTAFQHCAALVREADRDRYLATLFAPGKHREALLALYAFNVEIARVRDLAREPMPGEIRLQWWREVLGGERQSEARAHPVAAALRETLMRYKLAASPLLGLIDARTFDLYDEPMATLADLQRYGEQTDAAVFAMAGQILGAAAETMTREAGLAFAMAGMLSGFCQTRFSAATVSAARRLGPPWCRARKHFRRGIRRGVAGSPCGNSPAGAPASRCRRNGARGRTAGYSAGAAVGGAGRSGATAP